MKKSHLLGAARNCVLIASCLLTTTVNAMLINIDFHAVGTSDLYEGQGILGGVSDSKWNGVGTSNATNLIDSTGGMTTDVDIAVSFGFSTSGQQDNNALLEDRIEGGSSSDETITISDLKHNSIFDIVLYNGRFSQQYSIDGQPEIGTALTSPISDSINSDLNDWKINQEYAWLLLATSDDEGKLQINVLSQGNFAAIAGLQIQEVTAVPVPTAFWLFGSGLMGLFGIASQKKSA